MNSENRAKLIGRIQTLEGLTDEERSALLELLRTNKQYGLVWENKPEDVEERLRDELPVLIEDESKRIISDNPDAPNHILIEGDNLEALTTLAYTHAGKIDVIYIDPPYNTGNKDFTYYDDFCDEYRTLPYVDKEDSFRHSKWLSFMSKRLRIAKKLLSNQGVVFISIDDNEQANLKSVCDELFGIKNYVATLIWKSKSGGANDARFIATDSEYILVYCKDNSVFALDGDSEREVTTSYNREDENGRYALDRLDKQSLGYHESLDFPIIGPDGIVYTVFHRDPEHKVARWRWSKETVEERYDELVFENGCVYTKNYESESSMPRNLLFEERFGRTRSGKTELFSIIGANDFNNPKPSKLIAYFLQLFPNKSCSVLDFFAGSGTTLTAVMNQNFIDGGARTCILCTNNENNICTDVTYTRSSNVIKGYTAQSKSSELLFSEKLTLTKIRQSDRLLRKIEALKQEKSGHFDSFKIDVKDNYISLIGINEKNKSVEGLLDNSLRYYRTAFVGRSRSPQNLRKLVRLATDMLCIKEDLYEEKNDFMGQATIPQAFRYFEKGDKRMMVIYREEAVPLLVPLIEQYELPDNEKIHVYVFSPSEDPWAGDFVEVQEKVELCALPMAILNAYKRVLPKRKDQNIYVEPDMVPDQTEEENEFSDTLFPEEGGEA